MTCTKIERVLLHYNAHRVDRERTLVSRHAGAPPVHVAHSCVSRALQQVEVRRRWLRDDCRRGYTSRVTLRERVNATRRTTRHDWPKRTCLQPGHSANAHFQIEREPEVAMEPYDCTLPPPVFVALTRPWRNIDSTTTADFGHGPSVGWILASAATASEIPSSCCFAHEPHKPHCGCDANEAHVRTSR